MTACLSSTTASRLFRHLDPLLPAGICPLLFYSLTPYIITLGRRGWFGWVTCTSFPGHRKAANPLDFTRKNVNRRYPNEVLVRCPNPHSLVVAGLGPWEGGTLMVRFLHGEEACPFAHQAEQQFLLDGTHIRQAEPFYARFPEALLQALGKISMAEAIFRYNQNDNARLTVAKTIFPCRYHSRRDRRRFRELLPEDFCPHVFWAIYPRVFALMYGATVNPAVTVDHPGGTGAVALTLHKTSRPANRLARLPADLAENILRRLGHPVDRLNYILTIHVAANNAAGCILTPGKKYWVNLKNRQYLCPAAFQAVYPYLLLRAAGEHPPWSNSDSPARICCPDCVGAVYRLY